MAIKDSVVIATYNRARLLKKCLEAIASQNIPRSEYELIVVNDGSKDNTADILKEFESNNPELNFKWFSQKNGGPSKARNLGIKHSCGEIIFFTDDDCVVPNNWIEKLANAYDRHPDIAGAGGWYIYPEEYNNSFIKKAYIYYTEDESTQKNTFYGKKMWESEIKNNIFFKNPAGNTSNMSYKKTVLENIGGFDETIDFTGLVDWELKKRVMDKGLALVHIPYPVLHLKPLDAHEIAIKFFNRGRGHYCLVERNPELFMYYYPSLRRLKKKLKGDPSPMNFTFLILFTFEYILMILGWFYQNYKQKFR